MKKLLGGALIVAAGIVTGAGSASAITLGGASSGLVGSTVTVTVTPTGCADTIAYAYDTVAGAPYEVDVYPGPLGSAGAISVNLSIVSLGDFRLTAVCINAGSVDEASRQTITVSGNNAPDAAGTAAPASGTAPLAVTFDGSTSTDANGTIASYAWDFGDGSAAGSGVTTSHTYAAAGTFTATLTVTDNQGATDSATVEIVVSAAPVVTTTTVAQATTTVAGVTTTRAAATTIAAAVTTVAPTTTVSAAALPSTGSNSGVLAGVAAALLLAGGLTVLMRRRSFV